MTRPRLFYCTAWIGVVGAATFVATGIAADPNNKHRPCPHAKSSEVQKGVEVVYVGDPPTSHNQLKFHDPHWTTKFDFKFDDTHGPQRDLIPVRIVDEREAPKSGLNNPSGLNARLGGTQVLRGPGTHKISHDELQMSLEPWSAHEISICVRLDPAQLSVAPGVYIGTVGIAYQDVMRASVPVEMTFRAPRAKAALIVFLGVFLGLVVKVLSEAANIARTTGVRGLRAVWLYTSQLLFPVTVILSVVSGVFAYVTLYAHDRDWGADAGDSLRLFATCFVLQMGTSEVLAVLNRFGGGGPPGPPGPSGS